MALINYSSFLLQTLLVTLTSALPSPQQMYNGDIQNALIRGATTCPSTSQSLPLKLLTTSITTFCSTAPITLSASTPHHQQNFTGETLYSIENPTTPLGIPGVVTLSVYYKSETGGTGGEGKFECEGQQSAEVHKEVCESMLTMSVQNCDVFSVSVGLGEAGDDGTNNDGNNGDGNNGNGNSGVIEEIVDELGGSAISIDEWPSEFWDKWWMTQEE
ncbi:hypothetical protein EX30DRAFT_365311 [Ascodesmis nigricans]|uniref:Uncharacterized protein n=1 Tax=Ascodesmis nigricans TaxID=341454 RepID=A0A4S2MQH8_9PEZI|nr:hypothetical protein EX30DRAFT_365311 [Ascodesmis nigricans]